MAGGPIKLIALTLIVSLVFTVGFVAGRTPGRAVTEPGATPHNEYSSTPWPRGSRVASVVPGSLTVDCKCGAGRGSDTTGAGARNTRPTTHGLYRGRTASYWAARFRHRTRQLQAARAVVRRRWRPTVDYALHLASAIYGVPYSDLRNVAWCESKFDPFARNGRYLGLFQMHWSPFGFSPFDPVASALSAAATVGHDGSWRQWECKP